jgi:lysophospholipase L1-like esterase
MGERQVLFFGDSHVAGLGDPEGLGWVGRVTAASFSAGQPFIPYNLGVGGNTSVDVLRRWQIEARSRLRDLAETRLVLSFGVNDTALEGDRRRVEARASIEALAGTLDQAGEVGLATFVIGPAPVEEKQQTDRIAALSSAFARLCEARGVPFVDVVGALRRSQVWSEQVATDAGAHPGAEGYALLAELVMSSGWLEWLAGSRRGRRRRGDPPQRD